ncbi:MAG: hypothetical protein KC493_09075 [Bacteriovoracaceae bacterium]|nr:hypothetical protein [Bacteriovoracaceae bacterium]
MKTMSEQGKTDTTSNERWDFWRFLFRGKIYLINPGFQYKFMAWVLGWATFSLVVFFLSNYFFFDQMIAKGRALGLTADHAYFMLINDQKIYMARIYLVASTVLTVSITFWGLFFSHRIAGPMYRLSRTFQDAAKEGRDIKSDIRFRDSDFFAEVPDSINTYFESIETTKDKKIKSVS